MVPKETDRGKNVFVIMDEDEEAFSAEDEDKIEMDSDEDEASKVAAQKLSSSISSLIRAAAASFGERPASSSPAPSTPGLTLKALRDHRLHHGSLTPAGGSSSPLASALDMGVGGLGVGGLGGLSGIGGVVNGLRGRDRLRGGGILQGGGAGWANRVMNYGPNTVTPFLQPSQQQGSMQI